jgi:hypothetical protein
VKFSINNFLTLAKQIVMGGGRNSAGEPIASSGFLKDVTLPLSALSKQDTLTDNTGGTAGTTLAATAVKQTIHIPLGSLALLVNSQTFEVAVPFAFTISSVLFRDDVAVTTGAKAATLTTKINTTALTGGVVAVSGTYATGATQAGTAVSANNVGVAGDLINIAVSSVTAFTEGTGHVEVTIINNDLANTLSSLATQFNLRGLEASETNLLVQSFPASTTSLGSFSIVVPRDYDEATDTFALKLAAASAGATNTPGITATVYRKRPGAAIATVATSVAAKVPGVTTAAALTTASQVLEINLSTFGLQRDDALTIVLTADAHTTDAVLIYSIEPVYRSTLVSYDQTDGTSNFNGNSLR